MATLHENRAIPTAGADPMVPRLHRIRRIMRETVDTITFDLLPVDKAPPMTFAPGQFNMIYALGVGEVPVSISGDPLEPRSTVHTIRSVGAVTRALCALKPGAVVGMRGPFGSPWPVRDAQGSDVIVVAGGIGIAPIRPAIYNLLSYRDSYGRIAILYGARTPRDLLFRSELEKWRGRFDIDLNITVDSPGADWYGKVGMVTNLIPRAHVDPPETVAFVCGPEVMIRYTVAALRNRGVSPERIFVSLERNMKCGIGLCGHCQLGPEFVCKDGPVFPFSRVETWLKVREL